MANPILEITDGTTTVDLISPSPGIRLNSWRPNVQQLKGGGTFQDSPLADNRRLVDAHFENGTETFDLKIDGLTQDQVTQKLRDLIALLQKARDYWLFDWQNTPVYLIARSSCETNTRYATIHNYSIPDLDNPYSQPFFAVGPVILDQISLIVERGFWTANIPNSSDGLNVLIQGSEYSADGNKAFACGHWSPSSITHIYVDDGGAFGANQVASTAFNLLPAAPAINDAVYFGNDDGLPLFALIFDINSVFAGTDVQGEWEYWDGAAWSNPLSIYDQTGSTFVAFTQTGINPVSFRFLDTQTVATTAVNGVTAWWVRFRVTAATGVTTVPSQQNRIVYENNVPYMEVSNTNAVNGDLSALLKLQLQKEDGVAGTPRLSKYVAGLRSTDRGSNFIANINFSRNGQPTGISVSLDLTTGMTFVSRVVTPSGECLEYDFSTDVGAIDTFFNRWSVRFAPTISPEYVAGRYRVFLSHSRVSGAATAKIYYSLEDNANTTQYALSETITLSNTANIQIVELSSLVIGNLFNIDLTLDFYMSVSAINSVHEFYEIVLIPTDELTLATDIVGGGSGTPNNAGQDVDDYILLDGTNKKNGFVAEVRNASDDSLYNTLIPLSNQSPIIKQDTRLWIYSLDNSRDWFNNIERIDAYKNQRYLGLRGAE